METNDFMVVIHHDDTILPVLRGQVEVKHLINLINGIHQLRRCLPQFGLVINNCLCSGYEMHRGGRVKILGTPVVWDG